MTKKHESTVDKFLKSLSPEEKKDFELGRESFIISEMVLAAMQQDYEAVKSLAQMIGISANDVENIIPREKNKFNTSNFFKMLGSRGYKLVIEKTDSRIALGNYE